ncbi:hypothetical protein HDE_06553 [Halotydeus destructor]|nr:hypothetical protein HDE_06553 [Halotydeus destructor]
MSDQGPSKEMFYTPAQHTDFTTSATSNAAHYLASPYDVNNQPNGVRQLNQNGHQWTENIPQTMPWASPLNSPLMRFTGQNAIQITSPMQLPTGSICPTPVLVSPCDPCTSQTATQWELFHKLSSPTKGPSKSRLKRKNSSSEDDSDDQELQPPSKITPTEEKVAARLQFLNIAADVEFEEVEEECEPTKAKINFKVSNELKQALGTELADPMNKLLQIEQAKQTMAVVPWTPSPLAGIVSVSPFNEPYAVDSPSSDQTDSESQNMAEEFDENSVEMDV